MRRRQQTAPRTQPRRTKMRLVQLSTKVKRCSRCDDNWPSYEDFKIRSMPGTSRIKCPAYACFICAHFHTSFGIETVAIRRNTKQKTRQRGKVTITERSSVQQSHACFTYGRSLLQQLNTNVRARLDDKSLYGLCSKARVASLYCYHDDVKPCIAIWPSMHESNATLNPRFLTNYDSLGLPL